MSKENNVCYFIYMPLLFLLCWLYPFFYPPLLSSPSISCIIVFLLVQTTITIFPLCSLLFALLLFPILLLFSFRFFFFCWYCLVSGLYHCLYTPLLILDGKTFCAVALHHDYDCISSCHYYLLFLASTFARNFF